MTAKEKRSRINQKNRLGQYKKPRRKSLTRKRRK